MPLSRATRRGFSLVELLLVLTIAGIVSAVAVPRYTNAVSRYRAEMAAQRIAADLRFAATQARQIGKPVVVTFDSGQGTYTLSNVQGLTQRTTPYLINLRADPYRVSIGTANFGGSSQVTFDIYGSANAIGEVQVKASGFTRTAQIDSTGKVVVK